MQWDKEQEKISTEERLCELYETIEHQSMSFSILRQRQKAHAYVDNCNVIQITYFY